MGRFPAICTDMAQLLSVVTLHKNILGYVSLNFQFSLGKVKTSWFCLLGKVMRNKGGVRVGPLGTLATIWPIVPAPGDGDDECGTVHKMIGRGNWSTWRPAQVALCPSQVPHGLIWAQTRAAAVESQRLTAWAMAQPGNKGKLTVNVLSVDDQQSVVIRH
jgi:hypothetical protein